MEGSDQAGKAGRWWCCWSRPRTNESGRRLSHRHRKFSLPYIEKLVHINLTNYQLSSPIITRKQSMAEEKKKTEDPKTSCLIEVGGRTWASSEIRWGPAPPLCSSPHSPLYHSRNMKTCLPTELPQTTLILLIHILSLKDIPEKVDSELSNHAAPLNIFSYCWRSTTWATLDRTIF